MVEAAESDPIGTMDGYPLVDTHTHLTGYDAADPETLIGVARAAGVIRVLAVGTTLRTSTAAVEQATRFPEVFAGVGIHPNDLAPGDDWTALGKLALHPRVRAIGETGLDYYRDRTDRAAQRASLLAHFKLAAERDVPIVIHNRAADADILEILTQFGGQVRGVLHCFSGNLPFAEQALGLGYYLSFAGNLTYPSAGPLRETASAIPLDRVLVETDTPYLSPVPHRGAPNQPAYVVHTLRVLAACTKREPAELAQHIVANAATLFGW
ncbi:MAG TPA: TatD family hydrolase [Chloroflexota bacterium]|nr:TatD family hydrolase [Chloroflexota bacterium]